MDNDKETATFMTLLDPVEVSLDAGTNNSRFELTLRKSQ
jgi:hypothetical protein